MSILEVQEPKARSRQMHHWPGPVTLPPGPFDWSCCYIPLAASRTTVQTVPSVGGLLDGLGPHEAQRPGATLQRASDPRGEVGSDVRAAGPAIRFGGNSCLCERLVQGQTD